MRNKKSIPIMTSLFVMLSLTAGFFANLNKTISEVSAYDVSTLPTTINLNDCTEQEIRSYYSSLNSLDVSERKGTNLLKSLKPILSNNQKYYSYDSGDNVWKMYEITDRDWEKSPANAITYGTYNANTNTITGYQYGSNSNGKNNPYIHALYINRNIDNQTRAWGNHNQDDWGINREHIWAKSHGFDVAGAGGARGDPMHLWAANGWANHEHSNYFFAFVDKNRSYSDAGSKYNTVYNNLKGCSLNAGGNQTVFEPQDCDKGDIARAIFYMVARYNNYAGENSDFNTDNPNLVLLNNLSENSRTGTSSANDAYGMGLLSDLLAWNKLDPVDEYEIHRNNLLYRNFTNNRNPFIDFPSWADAIWGTADLDGRNYNSTITTNASPSTDPINGSNEQTLQISTSQLCLAVSEEAEVYVRNADDLITWTVDDNTIVGLSKTSTTNNEIVTITALKSGSAVLTATCGLHSVNCEITVTNYGTLNMPLTVSEATALIAQTGNNETAQPLYVKGVVSSNTAFNETYGNHDKAWLKSNDGTIEQAFQIGRYIMDSNIEGDYSAENSLKGLEVIAYGYGKQFNTTYELWSSSNNPNNPLIVSVKSLEVAREYIETNLTTSVSLSYDYTNTGGTGSLDTLDRVKTGKSSTQYGDPWTNGDFLSGVEYLGNSAGGNNSIQMRASNNSGIVTTSNRNNHDVKAITLSWNNNTANGRSVKIYGKNAPYSLTSDLYSNDASVLGTELGTLSYGGNTTLNIAGSYKYIGIKSSSGALYLDSIDIQWGLLPSFNFSFMAIRFGGLIGTDLWNQLDTESDIQGYGVLFSSASYISGQGGGDLKNYYEQVDGANIKKFYTAIPQDKEHPASSLNNYGWNLYKNISSENYLTEYTAVAFIEVANGVVFLNEVTTSVQNLAYSLLDEQVYEEDSFGGSLKYLANLS